MSLWTNKFLKFGHRQWEHVNIPMLYQIVFSAMRQCSPSSTIPADYKKQFMRIFAALVGMTGTDFSRALPHLGAKKIWDTLSDKAVWPGLMRSYDLNTRQLVPGE